MATVFISHVEEDQALALEIASGLERAGYTTWYYERDSTPGLSYLLQINGAIEACHVVVLVISPRALDSAQVTSEVVRAHETGKSFIPVRTGISHDVFRQRKPDWSLAVGAAASITVPETGAATILPEILEGLALVSAERARRGLHGDTASAGEWPSPAASTGAPVSTARHRTRKWAAAAAGALAVLLFALYGPGRDRPTPAAGDALPVPVEPSSNVASPAVESTTPLLAPPVDLAGNAGAGRAAGPEPNASDGTATRRAARERVPSCAESSVGSARKVQERGRLEARDDVSGVVYRFVICEERAGANRAVEMQITGSITVGTRWSGETAAKKAEDMDRRGVECESTGHAVRSTGSHDPRSIVFVLCQEGGAPTSIAVHATTRKADASAYPEKVLRVAWPR